MNRMNSLSESEPSQTDEAARAGWLYYVGGLTQDQIATELGVSAASGRSALSAGRWPRG